MGHRLQAWPSPGRRARPAAVAVAVAVLLVGALVAAGTVDRGRPAGSAVRAAGVATPPEATFRTDGSEPTAFPPTRLGVAFLALDDPIDEAVAVLGPPASTGPDVSGSASTWPLPGGASLTVSAWADGDEQVSGLYAVVPPGSPARVAAFGGVVVGRSPLREVVDAWGPGYTPAVAPGDDYVVSYVECVGPYPVVVKFDQASATDEAFAPRPGSPLWEQPVTAVLVAYADEPPGTAGCGVT